MSEAPLRLYVPAMDAVLTGFDEQGQVRVEHEGWGAPTLQEARAIIHAAHGEIARLQDLIGALERAARPPAR